MQAGVECHAGHCRFATSSLPTKSESHPHQWTPSRSVTVWRPIRAAAAAKSTLLRASPPEYADDSAYNQHASTRPHQRWQLQPVTASHGIFVTHNGDFDFFDLFGEKKTCAEVKLWLSAVLGSKAPAECDSIGIAGMPSHEYLDIKELLPLL